MASMEPVWDMVAISHAVIASMMYEEQGRHVNMGLLRPLLCLVRARRFTTSVVTPRGYKSRRLPLRTPTSSHTIHCSLLTSFPTLEKKERKKDRKRKKGKKERKKEIPRF
jgi:hypothetical protein